ncbi:MAG: uroporphyrinogen-III synthase [Rubrivivax sp.]
MRLIVTRPAAQAQEWVAQLRALDIDAVALPLIRIEPVADDAPLRAAWSGLSAFALVFFVSSNAVAHFFAARPAAASWPQGLRAAAPGPGTAHALRQAGVPAGAVVEPAADATSLDSEAVWERLQHDDWRGRRVLLVRGEHGRDWLATQLGDAGAQVDPLAAYARRPPRLDDHARELLDGALAAPAQQVWLFSSSEAVRRLHTLAPSLGPGAFALATHERIAAACRGLGFGTVRQCAPTAAEVAAVARSFGVGPIQSTPP